MKKNVGILLFNEVEVLDFAGPFEVFSVARQVGEHNNGNQLFKVFTIAEKEDIISATGGLLIQPQFSLVNHPPLDILIIPGGWGVRTQKDNRVLLEWIVSQEQKTEIVASVCTGAFLLAETGILNKHKATTHWNSIEWMGQTYPDITVLDAKRVVDEGHIVTSAGISAGVDMSLHLVARLYGVEIANWTAKRMEYYYESSTF